MPHRHLAEVVDDAVPSWFNKWAVRAVAGILSIGVPAFMTALYTTASDQLAAQRQNTVVVSQLQGETARLAESVKEISMVTKKLVEGDVAELRLEIAKMQAKGMLPVAEKKFEAIEAAIRGIEATLARTAPEDVKAEVQASTDKINHRLDALEAVIVDTKGTVE